MLRQRVCIIHNPAAGQKGGVLQSTIRKLEDFGMRLEVRETGRPGDGESLARDAARSGACEAVIAAGGDGTIREAANGLLGESVPLGIIPVGTANVLAAEIGLEPTPECAAHAIAFGAAQPIHLGDLNGRVFLLMASAGFDARAVAGVPPRLKKRFGKGAYLILALKHLLERPPPSLTVTIDGSEYRAAWAVISNGRYYGGKFLQAPSADLQQPGFVVSLFGGESRAGVIRGLVALGLGRQSPGKQISGAQRIAITSGRSEPVQADGDSAGSLPATVTVSPHRIQLIMPQERS
ncbi:MAG: diacylglycerol/lipid kinase family protein [Nitrospinales bacterium]